MTQSTLLNQLKARFSGGFPDWAVAQLAESSGLHASSVRRLCALWLGGIDNVEISLATGSHAAGLIGIVAPSNLFVATWQLIMEVVLLGGTARVRVSSRDRLAAQVLIELLRSVDSAVHTKIHLMEFDREDAQGWQGFAFGLNAVIAQGGDLTMTALRTRLHGLEPETPMRCHGHRLSWAYLDHRRLDQTTLTSLAHDVLLADGRGCMAPRAVLVRGPTATMDAALLHVRHTLYDALVVAAARFPAGRLPPGLAASHRQWIEEQRFEAAIAGRKFDAVMMDGFSMVVIGGVPGDMPKPGDLGPGGRLIVVRAAPNSLAQLESLCAVTSTVALEHPTDELPRDYNAQDMTLAKRLQAMGVRRVCAVGRMQAPSWAQTSDGQPLGYGLSGSSSA